MSLQSVTSISSWLFSTDYLSKSSVAFFYLCNFRNMVHARWFSTPFFPYWPRCSLSRRMDRTWRRPNLTSNSHRTLNSRISTCGVTKITRLWDTSRGSGRSDSDDSGCFSRNPENIPNLRPVPKNLFCVVVPYTMTFLHLISITSAKRFFVLCIINHVVSMPSNKYFLYLFFLLCFFPVTIL